MGNSTSIEIDVDDLDTKSVFLLLRADIKYLTEAVMQLKSQVTACDTDVAKFKSDIAKQISELQSIIEVYNTYFKILGVVCGMLTTGFTAIGVGLILWYLTGSPQ